MAARAIKRLIEVVLSAVALIVLAPVIAAVAVAIRLTMGRPVLFRQVRPGYQARPFTLVKFRTMTEARDSLGRPLPDSDRLTKFGRFLRRTSLDELPQLWNVLRGEMSLVGPRPLLAEYLRLYNPEQARRHLVRPGITGWAQVNGRNAVGWDERFRYDVWYVDHWSLGLDLRILGLTIARVLTCQGISERGVATMTPFQGSAGGKA
jgi:lipopolysaccharide/colanic/teichoic acid biosynthesis glycosyltransferase